MLSLLLLLLMMLLELVLGSLDAPLRVGVVAFVSHITMPVRLHLRSLIGHHRHLQRDHRGRATCAPAPHKLLGCRLVPAGLLLLERMRNALVAPLHKRRLHPPSHTQQIRGRDSESTAIVRSPGEGAPLTEPQNVSVLRGAVFEGEGARPWGAVRQNLPQGDVLLRHALAARWGSLSLGAAGSFFVDDRVTPDGGGGGIPLADLLSCWARLDDAA
ncbi:hypothetical protein T484DRAFT_1976694 [Baffinella frigidus]|nr:hypothetical protein T484DRAFT_1976694 [Cryptophyta sp. CCMP2293]